MFKLVANTSANVGETMGSIKQQTIMHCLPKSKACMFPNELDLYFWKKSFYLYSLYTWFFQGAIFSVSFSNDSPFLLACGGSKGKLKVISSLISIWYWSNAFVSRLIFDGHCFASLTGLGHAKGARRSSQVQQIELPQSAVPSYFPAYTCLGRLLKSYSGSLALVSFECPVV
jgi:WD40 repeat protein